MHQIYYIGIGSLPIIIVIAIFTAIAQLGIIGGLEVTKVVQIFGDVLSYLRLYALALAGTIMAATVNNLVVQMPFLLAIVILFIGHGINLALGVMGGIIHGLRLNFIEWYHYSFEGDGKLFNPLRLLKKEG